MQSPYTANDRLSFLSLSHSWKTINAADILAIFALLRQLLRPNPGLSILRLGLFSSKVQNVRVPE